jgi:hypothetical protein
VQAFGFGKELFEVVATSGASGEEREDGEGDVHEDTMIHVTYVSQPMLGPMRGIGTFATRK